MWIRIHNSGYDKEKPFPNLFGVGADNGGHPELEIVLIRDCPVHLNQLTLVPASFHSRREGGRGKVGGGSGEKAGTRGGG